MLQKLTIQNYAIIDHLEIDFASGLNIITGQTGAGKSILLGALGLIAGGKADAGAVGIRQIGEQDDGQNKAGGNCVVEATFDISGYDLQDFFEAHDLDYQDVICVRRTVAAAAGRSRAFVEDSPVSLQVLKELCGRLVDIHSQHQTLLLADADFQIKILDAIAQQTVLLSSYQSAYRELRAAERELVARTAGAAELAKQRDYLSFQVEQLERAAVKVGEVAQLELQQTELANATDIAQSLGMCNQAIEDSEQGVLITLKGVLVSLGRITKCYSHGQELYARVDSAYLELRDLAETAQALLDRVEIDPSGLQKVTERLDMIYSLCLKHGVGHGDDLPAVYDTMSAQLLELDDSQQHIAALAERVHVFSQRALELAEELHTGRVAVVDVLQDHVVEILGGLGIGHAVFEVGIEINATADGAKGGKGIDSTSALGVFGYDHVSFRFSGNKGVAAQPLEAVASGGEMSRLMLAIKSLVSRRLKLPTIIFDEIDTGVSGAVADMMGRIIEGMGCNMQVINITHLPQIAAKGDHHFVVAKVDGVGTTVTKLSPEERVEHIAMMLSGTNVTQAARVQAVELISSSAARVRTGAEITTSQSEPKVKKPTSKSTSTSTSKVNKIK